MDSCRVKVNSSVANLGPGFDVLAACVDLFSDTVTVQTDFQSSGNIKIEGSGVPTQPELNSAGFSVLELQKKFTLKGDITIILDKHIPTGFGLGSSGASSVGAVKAIDSLYGLSLSSDELVYYSGIGESAVSGSPHWDNVSASLMGGVTMVSSFNPFHVDQLSKNSSLSFTVIIPDIKIENKTKESRQLVPSSISMKDHIHGNSKLATLISGLLKDDLEQISRGMHDDIVEKSRALLYPYYSTFKENILDRMTAGVCLSGAGPSILVVSDKPSIKRIRDVSEQTFREFGITYSIYSGGIANGAYVEEKILS